MGVERESQIESYRVRDRYFVIFKTLFFYAIPIVAFENAAIGPINFFNFFFFWLGYGGFQNAVIGPCKTKTYSGI